jgi:hypothetical protein
MLITINGTRAPGACEAARDDGGDQRAVLFVLLFCRGEAAMAGCTIHQIVVRAQDRRCDEETARVGRLLS